MDAAHRAGNLARGFETFYKYVSYSSETYPISLLPNGAPSMDRTHGTDRSTDRFLPLKPAVLHILLALAEGEVHGYGVIQAVRERSDGRIRLQTGAFYRHLRKVMDDGLVEESVNRPKRDDPRRGAYYRLSPLGRQVLTAEVERLASLVDASRALGIVDGGSIR